MATQGKHNHKPKRLNIDATALEAAAIMLRLVGDYQKAIKADIIAAAVRKSIAERADLRERLFAEIRKQYAALQIELTATLKTSLSTVAENADYIAATDAGASVAEAAKPLGKKMSEYWKTLSPDEPRKLAAVLTDQMTKESIRQLRAALVDTYRLASVEGWSKNDIQKGVQAAWDAIAGNEKAFRFVDRGGRVWSNATYLQMLTRTTSAKVWRESYLDRVTKEGVDIVEIFGGAPDCDVCKDWDGKLVSITGATEGFPTLQDAFDAGVFHPNCIHRPLATAAAIEAQAQAVEQARKEGA